MRKISATKTQNKLEESILSVLAFFSLYNLPINFTRLYESLGQAATSEEIRAALENLSEENKIYATANLFSLKSWKADDLRGRQIQIAQKWQKIDSSFNWLALLPFVRQISVINSLALGTADADSDIDFFVVTKSGRLYFVRTIIIVLFRLLGIYKTRQKIKDQFCFGFFVTTDNLNLEDLLLKPTDPYFLFWLANMRPILGGQTYWNIMQANSWLTGYFPNLEPMNRLATVDDPGIFIRSCKFLLEIILWLPAATLEPILARIHIGHTFKLAENRSITSTTIANRDMLKLHAHDVRPDVARAFDKVLENLK